MSIQRVHACHIYGYYGYPTLVVRLTTDKGEFCAAVPSAPSTGICAGFDLPIGNKKVYYGNGVLKAIYNINSKIGPALVANILNVTQQKEIDEFMLKLDGTENKSNLGVDAILAVSLAVCKAGAVHKGLPLHKYIAELAGTSKIILPVPVFNVINGGSHARNKLAIRRFMILPTGAKNFTEAMHIGIEVYRLLRNIIKNRYGLYATAFGDEGGFAPNIQDNKEALNLIKEAIELSGYTGKVVIGMDVAASEFQKDGKYNLDFKNKNADPSTFLTGKQLADLYRSFIKEYPIVSIEDAFDQDDWEHWVNFQASIDIQLVGDDLTVTNPKRIQKAIDLKACNCLLLKVNQIGSVTESIEVANYARKNGWSVMVSHRSGETEDSFIADLGVGLGTGLCRSESPTKYNQLLRIESNLGNGAVYAGEKFRNPQKTITAQEETPEWAKLICKEMAEIRQHMEKIAIRMPISPLPPPLPRDRQRSLVDHFALVLSWLKNSTIKRWFNPASTKK